jgi:hypothetical protein
MFATRSIARQGLIMGLAGVEASLTLVASAAHHAGWWLDWNTRTHAGEGCQGAADVPVKATMRVMRAA